MHPICHVNRLPLEFFESHEETQFFRGEILCFVDTRGRNVMPDKALVKQIAELFAEAGSAHHQAFIQTAGADPEWPLWYADYLHQKLAQMLSAGFTKSELVYLLVGLEKEMGLRAPGAIWPAYYAEALVKRYLPDWYNGEK
jgi:hypothetical protein